MWPPGYFPPTAVMYFDPALGGWGDWCRQPLRYLHQSAPFDDRMFGKSFSWPPCDAWTDFPLSHCPYPQTMLRLPHCFEVTRSTVSFKPELVWGCATPHSFILTIDCADSVFPEKHTIKNLNKFPCYSTQRDDHDAHREPEVSSL